MDHDQLERAITDKTKAIIPVDIAGVMCDYDRIFEIVEKNGRYLNPRMKFKKPSAGCGFSRSPPIPLVQYTKEGKVEK